MALSTQKIYKSEFEAYLRYFAGEDYRYISREKIIEYLARLYDQGYSSSKVNQAINAIKFYKEKVLDKKKQTYFLKRPRREKFMPPILSQQLMFDVLNSPANLKHHTLLFVAYDNGLRISEVENLKLCNVLSKSEHPHLVIKDTKHNENRIIPLSEVCLDKIKRYYKMYKPKVYLFEGAKPGEVISTTTMTKVLKAALKKQKVTFRFRFHDLRHNFATHCLLNGTDIYQLSLILGHKNVQTTQKYYAHLLPTQINVHRPQMSNMTIVHSAQIARIKIPEQKTILFGRAAV